GLVTVAALDVEERLFSERQACIDCGVNIPTLEPRSFSFNSKYGACPACDGVGIRLVLVPEKIILDPDQAIALLEFPVENSKIQSYLRESLLTIARNFKLDENTPFRLLPEKAREIFFHGSPEPITYDYRDFRYTAEFKGIGQRLE